MEAIYLIAGLKFKIKYHHDGYLKSNIEKYMTSSSTFDYEIKVVLSDAIKKPEIKTSSVKNPFICYDQNQRYIYATNQNDQIQTMMIHDLDYLKTEIHINSNLVRDPAETEYVLLSVVFLEIALRNHFVPIHGSAIIYQDKVIIISAPSQTGKSTHARLWKETLQEVEFLNDDKPLIKYEHSNFMVYGSPFSGKTSVNQNLKKPLKAIIFIEQSKTDEVIEMSVKEKIYELMRNILRPEDSKIWDLITEQMSLLIKDIPMYRLKATLEKSSVQAIYQILYPEDYL